MIQGKKLTKANHYLSNNPWLVFGCILLICSILLLIMAKSSNGSKEESEIILICGSLTAGLLLWSLFNLSRSILFSDEGIIFRFLYWSYKTISWNQIVQVGIVHKRKNVGYYLVLTPCDVPKYDEHSSPVMYVVTNQCHLILLDATDENLSAINWHYGFIDYDTRK